MESESSGSTVRETVPTQTPLEIKFRAFYKLLVLTRTNICGTRMSLDFSTTSRLLGRYPVVLCRGLKWKKQAHVLHVLFFLGSADLPSPFLCKYARYLGSDCNLFERLACPSFFSSIG